jgi:hypothetical protein
MIKEFVTYQLALRLKVLGFDEPCFGCFDKKGKFNRCSSDYWDNSSLKILNDYFGKNSHYCLAPTWQTAFNWFAETQGLVGLPQITTSDGKRENWWWEITYKDGNIDDFLRPFNQSLSDDYIPSKFEAEQECLERLCEVVEKRLEDGEKG